MVAVNSDVALLAEGVDRNYIVREVLCLRRKSPSSQRAWIEIKNLLTNRQLYDVALLAEGVDRNFPCFGWFCRCGFVALLAEGVDRNSLHPHMLRHTYVALLAEGVDRNTPNRILWKNWKRRPPRRGRG